MKCKSLFPFPFLGLLCVAGCGSGSSGSNSAPPVSPTITSVSVSCSPTSLQTGQTSQCSASVSGTGSYSSGVTWSATGGTITPAGLFAPTAAGTATITAASTQDATKSGYVTVTVAVPVTITSVSVVCAPVSIQTNQTSICTPTVSGTGSFSSAVSWSVKPSGVGSVSTAGVFTPSAVGIATITATSTQDTTKSGSATVMVTLPATITSVLVACAPLSIVTTQTSTCQATVQGTGAFSTAVSWSTTGGTITSAGVFNPAAAGTATITAASTQDTTKSGTTSVTVATPTALIVTVSDLPAGSLANVTITDPNGQQSVLAASQTITAIPGTYTLAAAPVVVGTSTYHATQTTQTATVTSGNTSTAVVDYFNIVPNTTKVLDQTGTQNLTVNGSTLTINSASAVAQSLKPGDVLVSAPTTTAPSGLLVKVSAVTNSGSTIVVTTAPATLADEVTQAKFGVNIPFLLPNGQPALARGPATYLPRENSVAHPEASPPANPCATVQSLSLPFSYSLTPDQNQNTLTASGQLDFCNLHVDYEIDPLSTYAKLTVSLQQYSNLLVEGQYSTSFNWNQTLSLTDLENQVVCLGNETCQAVQGLPDSIGNALQVIAPSITPFVGMTGSASGAMYLGGSEAGSFQAGMQVQGATVSPIYSGTLQQQSYPIAVDGAASVKGYFGVSLGFTMLGSVTDHVDPRAYVLLQADTSANPWWTLSLGDEADAGITLSFLGFGSSEHDTPEYAIYYGQLAQAAGPFAGQPVLNSISPSTAAQYSGAITLSISGQNFVPGCYVTSNGSSLSTTYTDPTSLTAVLPASLLATSGSFPVAVVNSGIAGTTSNSLTFVVTPTSTNPVPTITLLTPASFAAGSNPQTLTIAGTGFLSSSTVTFNGMSHATTFVNGTQLTISLSLADLASVGTYPVVVTNPAPGGGQSIARNFLVINGQTSHMWTWISGSNTHGQPGVYGTKGVPAASDIPGARQDAASSTDSSGNLWLFGGYGYDSTGAIGYLNDLWEFNPNTTIWTWINGSSTSSPFTLRVGGPPGIYGMKGTPSAANIPGARSLSAGWTDNSGNLWLFGGDAYDATGTNLLINDLWEFSPTSKMWTWVSGSSTGVALGVYGTKDVPSATNAPGARQSAASSTDSSGNLWLFGGLGQGSVFTPDAGDLDDLWEFNTSTKMWTWVSGSNAIGATAVYGTQGVASATSDPGGRTQSTVWTDSSGNVWLFGGQGNGYLNDLWEFNTSTKLWTWVSGSNTTPGQLVGQPGVYGAQGIPSATNTPGGRCQSVGWTDSSGNLWLFGGFTQNSGGYSENFNDLWEFNTTTKMWTWVNGSNSVDASGVYGTRGVPSASNVPPSRNSGISWTDQSGNFWLFGGESIYSLGVFNDLWRYQP